MAAKKPGKPKTSNKKKVSLSPVTDDQWRIQSDAETLKRAMEVQSDPKRMRAAQEYCEKEVAALNQVSKLKTK